MVVTEWSEGFRNAKQFSRASWVGFRELLCVQQATTFFSETPEAAQEKRLNGQISDHAVHAVVHSRIRFITKSQPLGTKKTDNKKYNIRTFSISVVHVLVVNLPYFFISVLHPGAV